MKRKKLKGIKVRRKRWGTKKSKSKTTVKRSIGRKRRLTTKKTGRKRSGSKKTSRKILVKKGPSKKRIVKKGLVKKRIVKKGPVKKRLINKKMSEKKRTRRVVKPKIPQTPIPLRPIRFNVGYPNLQSKLIVPAPANDAEIFRTGSILHLPYNPDGQMSTQILALQKLGVRSSSYIYSNTNPQYMDLAIQNADKYDIFHFYGGQTFTINAYTDLPYLKMLNKKMVMNYWGPEVRRLSIAGSKNPFLKGQVLPEDTILQLLNVVSRFAEAVIVPDHEVYEYVKTFFDKVYLVRAAVDYNRFTPNYPDIECKRPLVVHTPRDPVTTGTDLIVKAVQRLKTVVDFDYVQIGNMKNEQVLAWSQKADIIIDQLRLGSYGTVSIEGMLMGKPVISYIREDLISKYPSELPVVNANPHTIEKVLHNLIVNPKLRRELGMKGRSYAVNHHAPEKIARQLITVYSSL